MERSSIGSFLWGLSISVNYKLRGNEHNIDLRLKVIGNLSDKNWRLSSKIVNETQRFLPEWFPDEFKMTRVFDNNDIRGTWVSYWEALYEFDSHVSSV